VSILVLLFEPQEKGRVGGFLETIDQLLSYLSWRDTKTAVVVFNRKAGFGAVLAKISDIAPKHPNFKRDLGKSDESTFSLRLRPAGRRKPGDYANRHGVRYPNGTGGDTGGLKITVPFEISTFVMQRSWLSSRTTRTTS
jgi:hypothetical protein